MNQGDLESHDRVELENGCILVFAKTRTRIVFYNDHYQFYALSNYNFDLTHVKFPELNVKRIFSPPDNVGFLPDSDEHGDVLHERKASIIKPISWKAKINSSLSSVERAISKQPDGVLNITGVLSIKGDNIHDTINRRFEQKKLIQFLDHGAGKFYQKL